MTKTSVDLFFEQCCRVKHSKKKKEKEGRIRTAVFSHTVYIHLTLSLSFVWRSTVVLRCDDLKRDKLFSLFTLICLCVLIWPKWHWKVLTGAGSSLQTCYEIFFFHSVHTDWSHKNESTEEACRINHCVCLVRCVQNICVCVCVCVAERKHSENIFCAR